MDYPFVPNDVVPAIRADNTAIKATGGHVFWVIVDAGATGGAWALESGGAEIIRGFAQASSTAFLGPFIPPVRFAEDITPDNDGTNVTLTVAFN